MVELARRPLFIHNPVQTEDSYTPYGYTLHFKMSVLVSVVVPTHVEALQRKNVDLVLFVRSKSLNLV